MFSRVLAFWQQAPYSPLNGSPAAADGGPTSSPSPKSWPGVTALLASRRIRLLVPTVLIICIFLFFGHRYDALSSLPAGWRKEDSPTSDTGAPTKQPPIWDPSTGAPANDGTVDWSRFAYTQYVTDSHYLCNSVMLFERLHHLGSRADRVMMYPAQMFNPNAAAAVPAAANGRTSDDARLLMKARDEYGVKLVPIQVQRREGADETWAESFTKLLAFNQTQYTRVLSLDSDSVILQSMDELFLLPPCPVAMPRAYWLYPDNKILSSQLILAQPSADEFARVLARVEEAGGNDYDMEIVNYLYGDSALVLPHRPYDLVSGEFREAPDKHGRYLGNADERWDAVAAFNEAKFVHFSDWPVPKPWLDIEKTRWSKQPDCFERDGVASCVEREIWNTLYDEFKERRKRVCTHVPGEHLRRRRQRG
ncbi:glycosyltransferase family 8 protein [Chaetomium fimeti]|uniref:Glycosyltransferase family 8 protein n=1 Tax=Chaetomium fimeti TaxID=1854472 RepID=A0AAE0H7Q8_9PEZI|nr:glycosyltransferase family 8 protein [Chaetomium fimeti]